MNTGIPVDRPRMGLVRRRLRSLALVKRAASERAAQRRAAPPWYVGSDSVPGYDPLSDQWIAHKSLPHRHRPVR